MNRSLSKLRVGRGALLLALGALGCSSGSSSPMAGSEPTGPESTEPIPVASSGSRLQARYLTTSDGLEMFDSVFDAELDTPCNVLTLDDGAAVCLPQSTAGADLYFADASCTHPVVPAFLASYFGDYLFSGDTVSVASFYEIASQTTTGAIFSKYDGLCELEFEDEDYHDTILAGSKLATLSTESQQVSSLELEYLVGADGSRFLSGLSDPSHDTTCNPLPSGDDSKVRCLPTPRAIVFPSDFFGGVAFDQSCQHPVAVASQPSGKYGLEWGNTGYDKVFVLGAQHVEVPSLMEDAQCSAHPLCSEPTTLFELGAEVPMSDWLALTSVRIGGSRITFDAARYEQLTLPIHPPTLKFCGSSVASGVSFYDDDSPCDFDTASDGVIRCLPTATTHEYSDPGCTEPVWTSKDPTETGFLVGVDGVFHATAAEQSPDTVLYSRSGSSCYETGAATQIHVYALASEPVPATAFAEGQLVTK